MKLLNKIKALQVPYIILERGALPQCLIWDDHDFNFNSKYYDTKYWDIEYTSQEVEFKNNFIKKIVG